jgi:hypothetical protein
MSDFDKAATTLLEQIQAEIDKTEPDWDRLNTLADLAIEVVKAAVPVLIERGNQIARLIPRRG